MFGEITTEISYTELEALEKEIEQLKAEIKLLEECRIYYSKHENWDFQDGDELLSLFEIEDVSDGDMYKYEGICCGKKARNTGKALEKLREGV